MVPNWVQNGPKIREFLKPNPPKMKTKSNEAWIKTSAKFLMLLSAPWGPRNPKDPQGSQGPQGTPGTPETKGPQGTPGTPEEP